MTCTEFKEAAPLYALGALEPDEAAACQAHLADTTGANVHDGCQQAWIEAQALMGTLAEALDPVLPSPTVWRAIEREVAAGAQAASPAHSPLRTGDPAVTASVTPLRRPAPLPAPPRRRALTAAPWLLAAAAAVALYLVNDKAEKNAAELTAARDQLAPRAARADQAEAALASERAGHQRCEQEVTALRSHDQNRALALALMRDGATRIVALAPQAGSPARATAVIHPPTHRGVVLVDALPAQPDRDYELWIIRGQQKLPAGLLHAAPDGPLIAAIDPALLAGGADALAVTVEPTGGSPQPTGSIVLVGAIGSGG